MKFSIVIATYNRAHVLIECVRSLQAQTHTDFEALIVDDGSTDGTRDAIAPYLSDVRIRFIELGTNHGCATPARNRGIAEMTGDALVIWDSDDLLYPNALATLQRGHKENPGAVFVCALTDWEYSGVIHNLPEISESRMYSYTDWYCGKRPKEAELISVRREAIGETRFKSRNIDFMFYNEILGRTRGEIWYINERTGKIRLESDSLSLTTKRKKSTRLLSRERAPYIANFLDQYGDIYMRHCKSAYGSYAYGASVGLLLSCETARARFFARRAVDTAPSWTSRAYYAFTLLPFSPGLLNVLFSVKELLQKVK